MFPFVCQELEERIPSPIEVDGVSNDPVQLNVTVKFDSGAREDKILYPRIHSFDTGILKEVVTRHVDIKRVTSIAVVMKIPPLTNSAVPSQLDDNERKKLLQHVFKMVQKAETGIAEVLGKPNPFQIKIEINNYSWKIPKLDETISNTEQIRNRIKVHRNALLSELDPGVLLFALSQYKAFPKKFLESLPIGCFEKIERILQFVENGSDEVAKEFLRALNDLEYNAMVEMIDPSDAKSKAENIKKRISSNYKDVLDEMQLSLAKEILSKCIGDTDAIMKRILPANGNRRQRMSELLHFVLQDDSNLIEFENILQNNDLGNIIDTWFEHLSSQKLQILLESFDVKIPSYPVSRDLLKGPKLTECVKEVRALARSVVLCKSLKVKNKKPGTVWACAVVVKIVDNQVVISEKYPEDWSVFIKDKDMSIVKVILIEGIWEDISNTKRLVYQKYKPHIEFGKFHLHHVSEKFDEIAKLSAHKKIISYKQHVESIRRSFPLHSIENIVNKAASRALSYENIIDVCRFAYISGIGNVNSGSYTTRSVFTLNRISVQLQDEVKESITRNLGTEICSELRKHIRLEPGNTLRLELIQDVLGKATGVVLASMLIVMISIVNPIAGMVAAAGAGLVTILAGTDANSISWRDTVAEEIYKEVSNRRLTIENEFSSLLRAKFELASDDLNTVERSLEDFRRRIDLID